MRLTNITIKNTSYHVIATLLQGSTVSSLNVGLNAVLFSMIMRLRLVCGMIQSWHASNLLFYILCFDYYMIYFGTVTTVCDYTATHLIVLPPIMT